MKHGLYRKVNRGQCWGCDNPAWSPCKKINAKNKCKQCRKNGTARSKTKSMFRENEEQ